MKILYISTPSFADCDFPLIREFQRKGVDVTYLILLPPHSLKSTLFDIKRQLPTTSIFKASKYPEFKEYESFMDMKSVYIANRTGKNSLSLSYLKHKYDLYKFITRGKFDIIHCDVMIGEGLKFMFGLTNKWVQTIHDPFPHSGEESKKTTNKYRNTISRSNYFVLLNEKQKKDFCDFYHVDKSRVLINRLGVYENIKTFVKSSNTTKRNNILFFGRISPYKGVEYLCEAMNKVREAIPDATLTIAGGGEIYFNIEQYKQLGYIEVRNHYITMTELAELISTCELTVCPYTDATQSGVIMTSYSLEKPVIATKVGGLSEMIEEGKTGLLVTPKNSDVLADAIIKLLRDRKLLNTMSSYIKTAYSSGEKSWSSIADKYLQLYYSIQ